MADPANPNPKSKTKPTTDRPGWNKDEWDAKAKAKDAQFAEAAKARDAALAQGKRPPRFNASNVDDGLPKPTEAMKMRTEDLGIERNLNKTMIVQTSTTGKGPRGAGFYCDLCDRTLKDSLSYLDHVNGRFHLRKLGQTTQVTRSTLSQVRAKIASLRASTAAKVTAQNFDFQQRINAIKSQEANDREARRADKKRKREERREEEELRRLGIEPSTSLGASGAGAGAGSGVEVDKATGLGVGQLRGKAAARAAKEAKREQERIVREMEEQEKLKRAKLDEQKSFEDMMGFGGFSGKGKKR